MAEERSDVGSSADTSAQRAASTPSRKARRAVERRVGRRATAGDGVGGATSAASGAGSADGEPGAATEAAAGSTTGTSRVIPDPMPAVDAATPAIDATSLIDEAATGDIELPYVPLDDVFTEEVERALRGSRIAKAQPISAADVSEATAPVPMPALRAKDDAAAALVMAGVELQPADLVGVAFEGFENETDAETSPVHPVPSAAATVAVSTREPVAPSTAETAGAAVATDAEAPAALRVRGTTRRAAVPTALRHTRRRRAALTSAAASVGALALAGSAWLFALPSGADRDLNWLVSSPLAGATTPGGAPGAPGSPTSLQTEGSGGALPGSSATGGNGGPVPTAGVPVDDGAGNAPLPDADPGAPGGDVPGGDEGVAQGPDAGDTTTPTNSTPVPQPSTTTPTPTATDGTGAPTEPPADECDEVDARGVPVATQPGQPDETCPPA